jgi:hypothetical protein
MAEDVTVAEVEDWAVGLEQVLQRVGPPVRSRRAPDAGGGISQGLGKVVMRTRG